MRPAAYGALFIVLFMLMRGAWLFVPIALVLVFVKSAHPWTVVARGLMIVVLAMAGGALSGLAYGLVGRALRNAVPGGRYLTGMLTVAPYTMLLTYIVRLVDGTALWRLPTRVDLITSAIMSVFFGTVVGYSWFGPDDEASKHKHRAT